MFNVYIPCKDSIWVVNFGDLSVRFRDDPDNRFKKFWSVSNLVQYLLLSKSELI